MLEILMICFQHLPIFKSIVKDLFSGLPEPPNSVGMASAHSRFHDMETSLEQTAHQNGLVPHKPWKDKCMQLYNVSQVHQGKSMVKLYAACKEKLVSSHMSVIIYSGTWELGTLKGP